VALAAVVLAGCGDARFSPDGGDLAMGDLALPDDARVVALDFTAANDLASLGPTFYIGPNGSDGNDGLSPAMPWLTFAFALGKLSPGATLILIDGSYGPSNGPLVVDCAGHAANGTAQLPITLRAAHERNARLASDGSAPFLMRACSYWEVIGLTAASADLAMASDGNVFEFTRVDHVSARRLLAAHPNRHLDAQAILFDQSDHILVEECEAYDFHRFGIVARDSFEVTIRRSYANGRGASDLDLATDCAGNGDEGIAFDHAHHSIAENDVVENACNGFTIHGWEGSDGALGFSDDNQIFGDLAMAITPGAAFALDSRCGGQQPCTSPDRVVENTHYRDDVALDSALGFHFTGGVNTTLESATVSNASTGGGLFDLGTANVGVKTATIFGSDLLLDGGPGYGLQIVAQNDWGFDDVDGFQVVPVYQPMDQHVTLDRSGVDPLLQQCRVYLPPQSPLKKDGKNGADIGANLIFRTVDGVLTVDKLWDQATGVFPCGVVIAGVNDVAGASCFDLNTRANIGANGCAIP
jgi:hypothetical protein